jgi:hypothetical protein
VGVRVRVVVATSEGVNDVETVGVVVTVGDWKVAVTEGTGLGLQFVWVTLFANVVEVLNERVGVEAGVMLGEVVPGEALSVGDEVLVAVPFGRWVGVGNGVSVGEAEGVAEPGGVTVELAVDVGVSAVLMVSEAVP